MSLPAKVMEKLGAPMNEDGPQIEVRNDADDTRGIPQDKENSYMTKFGPAAKQLTKSAMVPFTLASSKIVNTLSHEEKGGPRKEVRNDAGDTRGILHDKENSYMTKFGPAAKHLTKSAMVPFALASSKIVNTLSHEEKGGPKKKDTRMSARAKSAAAAGDENAMLNHRPAAKRISESAMVSYAIASAEIAALSQEDNGEPKTKENRITKYCPSGESSPTETKVERLGLRKVDGNCKPKKKKARTVGPPSSTFQTSIAASMLCRQLSAGLLPKYAFDSEVMSSDMSDVTMEFASSESEQLLAIEAAGNVGLPHRVSQGVVNIPSQGTSSPIKLLCDGQEDDSTLNCGSLHSC